MSLLVGIPVKPFMVAKRRLEPILDGAQRRSLGQAIAARTASLCGRTGADVRIVTGDDAVAGWARRLGHGVIEEEPNGGLDGAARRVAAAASSRWAVVHADLPLATAPELAAVLSRPPVAIVPAHDGGTNILVGTGPWFPFSYGPGSFHRHLSAAPDAQIVTTAALSFDLDTVDDLRTALLLPAGRWLRDIVGVPTIAT